MCFVLFGCTWDRLVALQKLSAKRAALVEKFVPRSRIIIFRNEHTELTPWDLNSHFGAFHTIWVHLGLFGCHRTLSAKRVKLVQKFMPRSLVGILATNTPDPPHWTLNSCFGVFRIIWVHLDCLVA